MKRLSVADREGRLEQDYAWIGSGRCWTNQAPPHCIRQRASGLLRVTAPSGPKTRPDRISVDRIYRAGGCSSVALAPMLRGLCPTLRAAIRSSDAFNTPTIETRTFVSVFPVRHLVIIVDDRALRHPEATRMIVENSRNHCKPSHRAHVLLARWDGCDFACRCTTACGAKRCRRRYGWLPAN